MIIEYFSCIATPAQTIIYLWNPSSWIFRFLTLFSNAGMGVLAHGSKSLSEIIPLGGVLRSRIVGFVQCSSFVWIPGADVPFLVAVAVTSPPTPSWSSFTISWPPLGFTEKKAKAELFKRPSLCHMYFSFLNHKSDAYSLSKNILKNKNV